MTMIAVIILSRSPTVISNGSLHVPSQFSSLAHSSHSTKNTGHWWTDSGTYSHAKYMQYVPSQFNSVLCSTHYTVTIVHGQMKCAV